tara:strand:+ start:90 stop:596 length:507 start_codon:yes stop_codon:yes gene_type:complete
MALKLEHDDLNHLIDKISKSDIQEFYLEGEDFKLEIKRNLINSSQVNQLTPALNQDNQSNQNQNSAKNDSYASSQPATSPPVAPPGSSDLQEITSPMVGTFYRASAPGEDPFVEIGSSISVGQTICILEAMKLMNEIESEFNGEVVEVLVDNGTPVEFGQVLMRVKKA